jgi:glutamate-1-semialdehyde 2,1-aminomutase
MTTGTILRNASRSSELYDRAVSVMPGGNTRTTVFTRPHPLYAVRGAGARVWDADGQVYIDLINNYTSLIHGHAAPEIVAAICDQAKLGTCFSMPTESEVALAELLCDRVTSIERLRFANSGSEGVMMAIKAARAFTGRAKIAKVEGSYHGSYDYMEVSEDSTPSNWGEGQPASIPYSNGNSPSVLDEVVVLPLNDVELANRILRQHADDLAAVIIDPLAARIGLVPAERDWLALVRRLCDEFGIVLISDEVISFRVARGGAQEAFGFRADLTALGKIIGGGLPIGAVGGRADIMRVFDPTKGKPDVPHGGTFNANPVTMVAGRVAMELMTEDAYVALARSGERLTSGIAQAFADAGREGQVTGLASLRRVHFNGRTLRDYRSAFPTEPERQQMAAFYQGLLAAGVLIAPTGLIALSTPTTEVVVDEAVRGVRCALGL